MSSRRLSGKNVEQKFHVFGAGLHVTQFAEMEHKDQF